MIIFREITTDVGTLVLVAFAIGGWVVSVEVRIALSRQRMKQLGQYLRSLPKRKSDE